MGSTARAPRRGDYGWDAPYVPVMLGIGGIALLTIAICDAIGDAREGMVVWALVAAASSVLLLASTASYVYATRAGKFAVWCDVVQGLDLRGDERVFDLGCGRGAVLLMVAKLLPRGRAVGVDLWKSSDQSGNQPASTLRNAELEGVAGRVDLCTADMRRLPFANATFDIVVSSLAIHNIHPTPARLLALDEATRVLKPGGRLVIADIGRVAAYRDRLRQLGLQGATMRALGWRFWYGGPWMAAKLVTATKPAIP